MNASMQMASRNDFGTGMQELSIAEVEEVSGGLAAITVAGACLIGGAFVVGIAAGCLLVYAIYEVTK